MKAIKIIGWIFPFFLFSCAKDIDPPQVLNVSESSLYFTGNGGTWAITVNSNCDWQLSGTNEWCTADKATGSKTDHIELTVANNDTRQKRTARLMLDCDQHQIGITIEQDTITGNSYHYELPIIFHLLYEDETDSVQYIRQQVIDHLITACNKKYKSESIDMNLELKPATTAPDGTPLEEPGIDRIKRTNAKISSSTFMDSKTTEYNTYLWNPNNYINVFVYTFKETNTLGVSHMPYTPIGNSIPGLQANNFYFTHLPDYTHCISLNNTYLNEPDAPQTLAHELGHYLGLLHVFSQDSCADLDYCTDTPTYNRTAYETWIKETDISTLTFDQLATRTNCRQETFTSRNIMDYEFSYFNRFTPDQFTRIRHVLENSPLIPGPKNVIPTLMHSRTDEKPEATFLP